MKPLPQNSRKRPLNEHLNYGDLQNFVSETFNIDRYTSKMGEDRDVIVLSFRVKDKHPAIDLMEFIERGYPYVLDADISAGEEEDGKYHVFVELPRTPKISHQLAHIIKGVSQLCDNYSWKFRYLKDPRVLEFNEESINENVPSTPEAYELKLVETKNQDLREFFDQGSVDVKVQADNTLTFSKPFSGDVSAKFISIGDYEDVKNTLSGPIDLSESSQSQIVFLNKFLGNYDIYKISNKFLIRNCDKAVVIEKDKW